MHVPVDVPCEAVELVRVDRHMRHQEPALANAGVHRVEVSQVLIRSHRVVVSHHQLLDAVEPGQDVDVAAAEHDVSKVPYRILRLDGVVPPIDKFLVVRFDGFERTMLALELDHLGVAEVRV